MSKDKDKKRKKRKAEKQKKKRTMVRPSEVLEHNAYIEGINEDGEGVRIEIQAANVDMIRIDPMEDSRSYHCSGDENLIGVLWLNIDGSPAALGLPEPVVDRLINDLHEVKRVKADGNR